MNSNDYAEKGKKACRTCLDFKSWMSHQRQLTADSPTSSDVVQRRPDCPVDKDELGRATWSLLHTVAAAYPDKPSTNEKDEMQQFVKLFSRLYPCEPCAEDFRRDMQANPPQLDSRKTFAKWLCDRHNVVNRKLGKTEFDCRLVDKRWKDGWPDGSCG